MIVLFDRLLLYITLSQFNRSYKFNENVQELFCCGRLAHKAVCFAHIHKVSRFNCLYVVVLVSNQKGLLYYLTFGDKTFACRLIHIFQVRLKWYKLGSWSTQQEQ